MTGDRVTVRRWFLQMDGPDELRPARERDDVAVVHAQVPFGPLNRWLYREIGGDFHWTDRREISRDAWQREAEAVETWLALVRGTPAGYAELRHDRDALDIVIFGVLERFRGQGVGGLLLTAAVRRGWALGVGCVTVDTCELDGPHALDHYRARGFRVVREALEERRLL